MKEMLHRKLPVLLAFAGIGAAVLSLASPGLRGATVQMPVSEIRPGWWASDTPCSTAPMSKSSRRILGVLENVIGTQRNLILARLEVVLSPTPALLPG
jgi:hypothetical protein